jgi:NAD dependent epimerase/dehydratase family enzyme
MRNADFAKVLGHAMHRPSIVPAPAFALELALGEMAEALLLASQRVAPSRLEQLGFRFVHRDLESALASILADR